MKLWCVYHLYDHRRQLFYVGKSRYRKGKIGRQRHYLWKVSAIKQVGTEIYEQSHRKLRQVYHHLLTLPSWTAEVSSIHNDESECYAAETRQKHHWREQGINLMNGN